MSKSKKQVKKELEEMALTLIGEQKELTTLEQSEAFKAVATKQKAVASKWADFKKLMKENMVKFDMSELVSPDGKDDWIIKLITVTPKVIVDDIDLVPEEYKEEIEVDMSNMVVKEGKLYRIEGNIGLVKNEIQIGMDTPSGFKLQEQTPRLTIKIDGKTV